MDVSLCVLLVASGVVHSVTGATKCHDCSSWNPYCREKVDEPFESAVAAVECEKTSTCFLKKDETGVINRGCADWWLESQIDMNYIGCQTQHVPWLGEMVWCFCKEDYCNGGSIDMMTRKEYPAPKAFTQTDWEDYKDWDEDEKEDEKKEGKEEKEKAKEKGKEKEKEKGKGEESKVSAAAAASSSANEVDASGKKDSEKKWGDLSKKWGKGKTFDDLSPAYTGGKKGDGRYQLWFWHADSDRPHWSEGGKGGGGGGGSAEKEGWRAPTWVEEEDGKGWDFPVTGPIHAHTAEETTDYHSSSERTTGGGGGGGGGRGGRRRGEGGPEELSTASQEEDTSTRAERLSAIIKDEGVTPDTWNWGQGWGHIKPWWLRDDEEEEALEGGNTELPKRWTPHPTTLPGPQKQDDGFDGAPSKWGDDTNSLELGINYDVIGEKYDVVAPTSRPAQEFFCWDCYSDSPLCGERVATQKANYLGKTSCAGTHRCFVRSDNGVIYRGCADGWTNSIIDTSYVGCRNQTMWNRQVEWCFCTASLCNGDSLQDISDKYQPHLETFKASTLTYTNGTDDNANNGNNDTTTVSSPFRPPPRKDYHKNVNNNNKDVAGDGVGQERVIASKKSATASASAAASGSGTGSGSGSGSGSGEKARDAGEKDVDSGEKSTTERHSLQKRSTTSDTGNNTTTDFHVGDETTSSSSSSSSSSSTSATTNWQTTEDTVGSDVLATKDSGSDDDDDVVGATSAGSDDVNHDVGFVNNTNYKALVG